MMSGLLTVFPPLGQYAPVNQGWQTGLMLSMLGLMLTMLALLLTTLGWMARAARERKGREEAERRLREAGRARAQAPHWPADGAGEDR
jgi:hypothetical protein